MPDETTKSNTQSRPEINQITTFPLLRVDDNQIGTIKQKSNDRYSFSALRSKDNISRCLDQDGRIDIELTATGLPTLWLGSRRGRGGSTSLFVPLDYASNTDLSGTAESVNAFDFDDDDNFIECTTCYFEYDIDNNRSNGFEAAVEWSIGSNDGTPCPTQAPSSEPSSEPSASTAPSDQPSTNPSDSSAPSDQPSASSAPSNQPSTNPSASSAPSNQPSNSPSESQAPSSMPSNSPSQSQAPSNQPTFCLKKSKTKSPGKGTKSPGKGRGKGMMMTKSPVQTCFETAFPTNSPGKGKRDV